MAFATLSILASAASAAADRPAQVERLLFELCPRILAGEVDLRDPAQLEAEGLQPSAGILGWVHGSVGKGKRRLTVGFRQFTGKRVCKVELRGPDHRSLYLSVIRAGEARGWRTGAGAAELGGFISFLYAPEPSKQKILFTHWPKHGGLQAATHAGLILDDEERVRP